MKSETVSYQLDDGTSVQFEIEPTGGWENVSARQEGTRVREAVQPAIDAARTVLDRVVELRPDDVTVKFGLKASGTANWLVARAATEANFEVTMTWKRQSDTPAGGTPGADSEG
ncbi:CU044_2847 family protein [Streptomyces shenzhenensis]|uniref:CU044_2847 family protein n=1 Tax=Streptomyces TaxID=1883 RepID=UPI003254877D